MICISDKKKEASVYGAVAIIIIFVVGLFSEILLGVGTRLAIAWPLVSKIAAQLVVPLTNNLGTAILFQFIVKRGGALLSLDNVFTRIQSL